MLVSVIIPCYNSELYLKDTLQSVLDQTHQSIEIICVDNGSSDSTKSIIASYPEVILLEEAQSGASHARNLGLNAAKGEYVQFLDSDDLIHSEKIEKQLNYLIENNLDVVVSDRCIKNSDLTETIEVLEFSNVVDAPLETAITEIIITGNPLYKTTTIIKIGGYKASLIAAQDWDFHIRLFLEQVKTGYLPGQYLICRQVKNSLSSNWLKVSLAGADVIDQLKDRLINSGVLNNQKVLNKIFSVVFLSAIHVESYSKSKSLKDLLAELIQASKYKWPENFSVFYRFIGIGASIQLKRIFSTKIKF